MRNIFFEEFPPSSGYVYNKYMIGTNVAEFLESIPNRRMDRKITRQLYR